VMGRRTGDGCADAIAVFPILANAVDVKRGDQLCETCLHTWHGYGHVAGRSRRRDPAVAGHSGP